ncbi:MAG: DUF4416 family protein [Desulfobacteraceae bacterium]|jgi:hypothetical protein
MSIPSAPDPAKLVIGVYTGDKTLFDPIFEELTGLYGRTDTVSDWMAFDRTDYYEAEMGKNLFRRMVSFETLISQEALADIKVTTNGIESKCLVSGRRKVNIDPGYMLLSRFILATGKDFAHRIYIGKGIYADLTLIYKRGTYQTLPWTYPDYADTMMTSYLLLVRNRYACDLKGMPSTLAL